MQQPRSASTMIPGSESTSTPSLDEPDSEFALEWPLSGEVQDVEIDQDVLNLMGCELPENMAALKFLINFLPSKNLNSTEGMQKQWSIAKKKKKYNDDKKNELVQNLFCMKDSAYDAFDVSETALWFITYLVPGFVEQVLLDGEEGLDAYYAMAKQINRYMSEDASMETKPSLRP